MKLAILNLTGGGISGGYKNYLQSMLPRLAADRRVTSVLCVSPRSLGAEELAPAGAKLRFADCAPYRPLSFNTDPGLHRLLSSYSPDIIFVPTARTVSFKSVPVVTMIQNMAPLVSWKWYGPWQKVKLLVQLIETWRAVRNADRVIAISGFVKDFLVKKWQISGRKVVPVYFGVPDQQANPVRPDKLPAAWQDFVFTAGSIEPYRSLEDLIKCAEYSRKTLKAPLKIMVAGSPRTGMDAYGQHLRDMAESGGVSDDICWAGQLSHEEMTWCYRNCSAFIMTSRVEACPNTVLEAMSCGAVCIAADNPPLPEFFEKAALYYSPGDSKTLALRIREITGWDRRRKSEFSATALARAGIFQWGSVVDETITIFEDAIKGGGGNP